MRQVAAMILAGGQGPGLGILTRHRPASAMPFGGKYRVIDFSLSNCTNSELYRVAVLTQYAPMSLNEHIRSGRPWDLDRRDGGVQLLQAYARRTELEWYRGTADAIAQNLNVLDNWGARWVLVLSADQVYKMDYLDLISEHQASSCPVTLTVKEVPENERGRFGMVEVDPRGRVVDFVEKPSEPRGSLANLGIYVFDSELLYERLRDVGGTIDLVTDVIQPLLGEGVAIHTHRFRGYWDDIGTIDSYFRSNMELLAPRPRLNLANPDWRIFTASEERPPVHLGAGGRVSGSLVANGARVYGEVVDSILFPGVVVERDARVTNSIVMQDTVIGGGTVVDLAILDKSVRLGRAAQVGCGSREELSASGARSGLVVVGKNASVPAGCRIGRGCVIDIGARVEDFASNDLVPGTTVPATA